MNTFEMASVRRTDLEAATQFLSDVRRVFNGMATEDETVNFIRSIAGRADELLSLLGSEKPSQQISGTSLPPEL